MKFSTKLLGAACALAFGALIAAPASAEVSGVVGGSYANLDIGPGSADIWGGNAALTGMFDPNWGAEGDVTYHNLSGVGSTDIWSFGGNVFWRGMDTRIAGTVMYHDIAGGNVTNYGVGAEFFADSVTFAVKGGGLSGSGSNGGYVGGDVKWYAMPNLAFDGRVDYADQGGSITTETLQAEWLFSQDTPVSLYAGYQHGDVGGFSGNGNVWFVGIKLYANGDGAATLVDRQRSGTLGYLSQSPIFIDQY